MNTNTPDINEISENSGFEFSKQEPTIIKVIGVGGGGGNAVSYMYSEKK